MNKKHMCKILPDFVSILRSMKRTIQVLIAILAFSFGMGSQVKGQTTFYWIGGSGDWNDPSNWSYTSGGTAIDPDIDPEPHIPNDTINVQFNSNSGYTVTVDVDAKCADMNWENATGMPTLAG